MKILVTALPLVLASLPQARAALITEWSYQIDSAFTAFSPPGVVPSGDNPNLGNDPTVLSWGAGASGPSSLSVEPTITDPPNVITNGGSVQGATLVHQNNPITGTTLTST